MPNDTINYMTILSFCVRKKLASITQKIGNTDLRAGSQKHFYCKYCQTQTEVLDDGYLFKPRETCSQCEEIEKAGLIDKAEETYKESEEKNSK